MARVTLIEVGSETDAQVAEYRCRVGASGLFAENIDDVGMADGRAENVARDKPAPQRFSAWLSHKVKKGFGLIALCCATSVVAEGLKHSDGSDSEISVMLPGDQKMLTGQNATIRFAGRSVILTGFTGLLGYASDVAYVVTIDGRASTGDEAATRGRMIILPPLGERASVTRFDAGRLINAFGESEKAEFANGYTALQAIAKSQARGVFFGSLGRTSFNVATSGVGKQELARRSIVGGSAIQDIRFSQSVDKSDYERAVVTRFLSALVSSDVATAAQLMDPLPFGLSDMRGEPGDARSVAAQHLIYGRNWATTLGAATPVYDAERKIWTAAGQVPVSITLRTTQDIPFIKSIRIGDGQ